MEIISLPDHFCLARLAGIGPVDLWPRPKTEHAGLNLMKTIQIGVVVQNFLIGFGTMGLGGRYEVDKSSDRKPRTYYVRR